MDSNAPLSAQQGCNLPNMGSGTPPHKSKITLVCSHCVKKFCSRGGCKHTMFLICEKFELNLLIVYISF